MHQTIYLFPKWRFFAQDAHSAKFWHQTQFPIFFAKFECEDGMKGAAKPTEGSQ